MALSLSDLKKALSEEEASAALHTANVEDLRRLIARMEGPGKQLILPIPNRSNEPRPTVTGEYSNLSQMDAALSALTKHGPMSSRQLLEHLAAGGQQFKKLSYLSSILYRLRGRINRTPDGRYEVIAQVTTPRDDI